jgi:hypothetical protein
VFLKIAQLALDLKSRKMNAGVRMVTVGSALVMPAFLFIA